jgi:predicted DNA binding CopG/RHH family protein
MQMKKSKLDKEEQEVLDSFERGEWKPVANRKREIERHRRYARNTLAKDCRVNIRISSKVLDDIQAIAVEDGLPYQTLMASVLHRFAAGRLVDVGGRASPSRRARGTANS